MLERHRRRLRLLGSKASDMMLDLFYVGVAVLFFASTWYFTKACDKL
jgi:hypothetical protein